MNPQLLIKVGGAIPGTYYLGYCVRSTKGSGTPWDQHLREVPHDKEGLLVVRVDLIEDMEYADLHLEYGKALPGYALNLLIKNTSEVLLVNCMCYRGPTPSGEGRIYSR